MEKRELIMEKALELFAERGFSATSVQEITEHSGISKGAFYLSFKSKDELISEMIHEYLETFVADVDQLVSESDPEQLLYNFYFYHLESFSDQSGFAKIFVKEQTHFFNEEFLAQILCYNEMIQNSILVMLENVYGESVATTKYDLVYAIQGLMKSYMELLLFGNLPLNNKYLAESLVEKTNVLANHMTFPAITSEIFFLLREPSKGSLTIEKVMESIDDALAYVHESIERESLLLLKEELNQPFLSEAVKKGLLKNIKNHPSCKRVSYFLHMYWGMKQEGSSHTSCHLPNHFGK
ncbi:TetR/AcrR family transcriptional regulator [Oceanobacillus luteolus]|uniref:TetR/AcrR family transcriptional regulator n=1 Tax=Oceanobacillus luteolus TaxID=1274358 RepID=A0ABW4HL63_9BACI